MTSYRHGALHVIETPKSKDEILRALKRIDDRLFIEKQVTFENEAVWCVVVNVGGDIPPLTILEWRDEHGNPIPDLTSGIIGRVERMERDAGKLTAKVIKANADRLERARRDAREAWQDMGREFEARMKETRSAVLHRGIHLRRHRDRLRAMGAKV